MLVLRRGVQQFPARDVQRAARAGLLRRPRVPERLRLPDGGRRALEHAICV